ncbi:MAG: helix-turn-helix domain-containing protein [Clostridia bacterium]|nr:helix-turn-helix domain-containing protein [Clostridia bacterium]
MFNERLKYLRKLKGYTQKELAAMISCDQSMIARWEKGECEPTASAIKKIAVVFNVSADYLLGLDDEYSKF